jgi:transposase-like protein/IS1 family transposase
MTCHNCRIEMVKAGFYGAKRVQRWKRQQCSKRFSEPQPKPFGADVRLPVEKVTMILHCLAEGNSVRSTARLCDIEKRHCCERFMEQTLRNVLVRDLELDEFWSYVLRKQGHTLPHESNDETIGDQYIYIALERSSKLVAAWHLGKRDWENTSLFITKVRNATARSWFDVSTDAWVNHLHTRTPLPAMVA